MITLKKILVPVDFSRHSENAVRYGAELAAKFHAELVLLHVVDNTPVMFSEGAVFTPESMKEVLDKANAELGGIEIPEGLNVTRVAREGHPFVEIVRFAKANGVDLIVVGTHGRTGLAHLLLGSVAENVVRKAPCPVLTVHHPEHEFVLP